MQGSFVEINEVKKIMDDLANLECPKKEEKVTN